MSHTIRRWFRDRIVRAVQEGVRAELQDYRAQLGGQLLEEQRESLRRSEEAWHAAVRELEDAMRHDVGLAMDAESVRASARLVLEEMHAARPQVQPRETLLHALEEAPGDGMMLEFGVATGSTLRLIAERRGGRPVYGFDSFAGLPERWRPGFDESSFAQHHIPDVPGADLVVGLFDETLPLFCEQHPEPVAFLHCDADLYSSTRTILEHVGPRLRRGSIVLFDEYFNYPWWQEHEHRAWREWTSRHGVAFEYIAFTWEHEQVAVRVLATPWDDAPRAGAREPPG